MNAPPLAMGFFPLDANPAAHMARVPFAHTLGFVWEGDEHRTARVRLPLSAAATVKDEGRVDRLAMLALLDHACSAAVYLALPRPSLIATVDLRCEFGGIPDIGADIVCEARTQHLDEHFAVVRASASSARTGTLLAWASSTYAVGAHPGMAGKKVDIHAWSQPAVASAPQQDFRSMLALSGERDFELPFHERLVGAVTLPAVHGGATSAALTLAAMRTAQRAVEPASAWEPLSVTVHFLRAVQARGLSIRPTLRKPGSRRCIVGVSSFQRDACRESAHAECLLSRALDTPHS